MQRSETQGKRQHNSENSIGLSFAGLRHTAVPNPLKYAQMSEPKRFQEAKLFKSRVRIRNRKIPRACCSASVQVQLSDSVPQNKVKSKWDRDQFLASACTCVCLRSYPASYDWQKSLCGISIMLRVAKYEKNLGGWDRLLWIWGQSSGIASSRPA